MQKQLIKFLNKINLKKNNIIEQKTKVRNNQQFCMKAHNTVS